MKSANGSDNKALPPKRTAKPKSEKSNGAVKKDERVGEDLLKHVVLTPSEVAQLLRIDETLVMALSHDGYLPALKIGRGKKQEIRFLRRDVLVYLRTLSRRSHVPTALNRLEDSLRGDNGR